MRKHDVRKWLHAVLDLLPVILIPVFMIYSHRHDVTENVDVQYKYESNEVNSLDDLVVGNLYHFELIDDNLDDYWRIDLGGFVDMLFINIDEYNLPTEFELDEILSSSYVPYGNFALDIIIETDLEVSYYLYPTHNNDNDYWFSLSSTYFWDSGEITLIGDFIWLGESSLTVINGHSITDQITMSNFNVIESVDIENIDVMDSFMNHFNNTIDRHFNMGNVFNLNGVYQWFNTNIFSGNAPTIIYSIWNIALYELVMDLLFLLYGLFMWFIDMIQKLMEKPLNSVK